MAESGLVTTRTSCRSCGSRDLVSILSLQSQYVSNFVDSADSSELLKAPLELVLCDIKTGGCGLIQLRHTVSPELLYKYYWYRSMVNDSMKRALADVCRSAERAVDLYPGDLVVDIGCNDGTLLRSYETTGLVLTGFEPANNLIEYAEVGTTRIINDFFNFEAFRDSFPNTKAKIITSIAMFYDLEDPNAFVSDATKCLHEDGVWVIQMSYLPSMLEQNAFDNICHEHLEYYSLLSVRSLLERHGLEVSDVELNDVNGGSFRLYVSHRGRRRSSPDGTVRVREMEEAERAAGLHDRSIYVQFAARVNELKASLVNFVTEETDRGKTVYAYGASTKGNTLLQFCGLDNTLIGAAAERNPDKWGKNTVGTLIPIISEEQARADRPDYFLILPWHFLDGFKERERAFLENGGKFIVPVPEFRIIGGGNA